MAENLKRIFGTEEDRVNCPFYWKIGACRHGDQCSRYHYKPTSSQTLIIRHMYQNPPVALAIAEGQTVSDDLADQAQDHFESFYGEVFEELMKHGELEELVVCDNIGDHMIGNVYVKFINEEDAESALQKLTGRYYAGRLIQVEYSPVTDFREARCRQFVDGQCTRGGYCNFMHMKHLPRSLRKKMFEKMYVENPQFKEQATAREANRERSRSPAAAGADGGRDARGGDEARGDPRASNQRDEDRGRGGNRDNDYRRDDRRDDHRIGRRDDKRGDRNSRGRRDSYEDRGRNNRRGDRRDRSPVNRRSRDDRHSRRDEKDTCRSSSYERKAMIAKWNEEREGGTDHRFREGSEERRAVIAKWNEEVEVDVKREASHLPPPGSPQ